MISWDWEATFINWRPKKKEKPKSKKRRKGAGSRRQKKTDRERECLSHTHIHIHREPSSEAKYTRQFLCSGLPRLPQLRPGTHALLLFALFSSPLFLGFVPQHPAQVLYLLYGALGFLILSQILGVHRLCLHLFCVYGLFLGFLFSYTGKFQSRFLESLSDFSFMGGSRFPFCCWASLTVSVLPRF